MMMMMVMMMVMMMMVMMMTKAATTAPHLLLLPITVSSIQIRLKLAPHLPPHQNRFPVLYYRARTCCSSCKMRRSRPSPFTTRPSNCGMCGRSSSSCDCKSVTFAAATSTNHCLSIPPSPLILLILFPSSSSSSSSPHLGRSPPLPHERAV